MTLSWPLHAEDGAKGVVENALTSGSVRVGLTRVSPYQF